jgi:hypothetical protein
MIILTILKKILLLTIIKKVFKVKDTKLIKMELLKMNKQNFQNNLMIFIKESILFKKIYKIFA